MHYGGAFGDPGEAHAAPFQHSPNQAFYCGTVCYAEKMTHLVGVHLQTHWA